jgi:phage shock protein A
MRLIIQEMEETLVEVRATAARGIAEKKDVERRLARLADAQAEWERKAEVALRRGREDLSKAALIEKARLGETVKALTQERDALNTALTQGEADIAKLEAKLRDAKTRQKTMEARHETASNRLKARKQVYDSRVDDAFSRFESFERRIDEKEGQAEALELGKPRTVADELADLEANAAIEEELQALKQRVAKSGQGS